MSDYLMLGLLLICMRYDEKVYYKVLDNTLERSHRGMQISERDWKIFRKNIPDWQERYMERLEMEYIALLQNEKSASTKFWELEKRIKQDKKSPGVIIDMRRSTAINNIVSLVSDGVISLDDLEEFSDDLKEAVKYIVEKW